jgi:hypothetical protein
LRRFYVPKEKRELEPERARMLRESALDIVDEHRVGSMPSRPSLFSNMKGLLYNNGNFKSLKENLSRR